MDEVELSLLDKDGPLEDGADSKDVQRPISSRDRRAIILLIVLCELLVFKHIATRH